ncbi:MAG: hypothetical protein AVO35_07035 [Candidatus Aegiribacteria sp. MLS_C]|nr:MAG: hypothetical protein AVO35_07035 [Candidatus Aegiribacteria sp. MLS_C]
MRSGVRRTLLVVAGGLLLLLVLEAGIYNLRLALAMRYRDLAEQGLQLTWKRDELLVERASLLNPARLHEVGTELGLGPLPLDRVRVFAPQGMLREGGDRVCMEQ